ncbi:MAG: glycosyl hydrolase [Cyclobacteriaceae bacterium]
MILICLLTFSCTKKTEPLSGEATSATRPWTYWWWMGNAVNKAEIAAQLNDMQQAGMGGVHIIPIYGVRGEEERFLPYLSPEWQEMVSYAIRTADSLGMGTDLTLGTGWPYGGPMVSEAEAARKVEIMRYELPASERISFRLDTLEQVQALADVEALALSNADGQLIIPEGWEDGVIEQRVERGDWTLYLAVSAPTGQLVKRAAPGGEGPVMDYFDQAAVEKYLDTHDSAFADILSQYPPRAFYHDSYEAYGANWSADFTEKFVALQGYPLASVLPVLADTAHDSYGAVLHDVRETLAELLYTQFTQSWTSWAAEQSILTRNQAHGSPGNILDLYALASIPETESFGTSQFDIPGLRIDEDFEIERFGQPSPLMMKFASSPAHLLGKPLVSSETATWLGNHFKVALSQVKPQVDELFTAGINHIFFHGMAYSPERAGFPGWLFYASTNFNRNAHFWDELPELNQYISKVQSYLQHTEPDHDLLLYFPIHDLWTEQQPERWLLQLDVHKYERWFSATPAGSLSEYLWEQGYTFDYLSDRQLAGLSYEEGKGIFHSEGTSYQSILMPPMTYLPLSSLRKLHTLAEAGAQVVFTEKFPEQIPGYGIAEDSARVFKNLLAELKSFSNVRLLGAAEELAEVSSIQTEEMKQQGLNFIRKKHPAGHLYFVTNLNDQFSEGLVRLSVASEAVEIVELIGGRRGLADSRMIDGQTQLYLQLPPGSSALLITYDQPLEGEQPPFNYLAAIKDITINNPWYVKFVSGNTEGLQDSYRVDSLVSWTEWGDSSLLHFSGKAHYLMNFTLPPDENLVEAYRLVFNDLRESARVILNGEEVGTIWALPYELLIPAEKFKRENQLEVIVQNLSANRIIGLDKQEVEWKNFYDINFVDITYQKFDASGWEPLPSGIIGNIKLQKIQYFH